MTTARKPRTATQRSRARYRRAARVLSPVTLDAEHARKLDAILAGTGESAAAWVRRMIREARRACAGSASTTKSDV